MGKRLNTTIFKKQVQNLVGHEYSVIGEYENNKIKITMKHNKCQHTYLVRPNDFKTGYRCPYCNGNKAIHLSNSDFKKRINGIGKSEYTVVGHYKNSHKPVLLKHNKCGYLWKIRPTDFYNGSRCPHCKRSHGEYAVEKWLIKNHFYYISPFNIGMNNRRLDFYIPSIKTGIEFDGQQHFQPTFWNYNTALLTAKSNYYKQVNRDQYKNMWCKNHNISLVRIEWNTDSSYVPTIQKFINKVLTQQLRMIKNGKSNKSIYRWWFKTTCTQRRSC